MLRLLPKGAKVFGTTDEDVDIYGIGINKVVKAIQQLPFQAAHKVPIYFRRSIVRGCAEIATTLTRNQDLDNEIYAFYPILISFKRLYLY